MQQECSSQPGPLDALTRSELDVLALAAEAFTQAQIAEKLVVGRETVKTHVAHIRKHLGVHSTREAVRIYRAQKITPLGG